jgi:hypothetical protein
MAAARAWISIRIALGSSIDGSRLLMRGSGAVGRRFPGAVVATLVARRWHPTTA